MYIDVINSFAKTVDIDINNKNIKPGYRNGFWYKKCSMLIMKSGKRERIELLNQERIKTLREKENYKYLEILEADAINQAKMKEKISTILEIRRSSDIFSIYSHNICIL